MTERRLINRDGIWPAYEQGKRGLQGLDFGEYEKAVKALVDKLEAEMGNEHKEKHD